MNSLTPLQIRALILLAGIDPPWTLTGGAALAGFHLGHRTTQDLDLFWHGARSLDHSADEVSRRLVSAGLSVHVERSAPAFRRLRVSDENEVLLVDLVADPVAVIEAPELRDVGEVQILVDTAHELLVNKLTTLLSRSELRDLVDVRALIAAGGDLERAILDAPRKDGGFSGPTVAWVLKQLPIAKLGASEDLGAFRDQLVARFLAGPAD